MAKTPTNMEIKVHLDRKSLRRVLNEIRDEVRKFWRTPEGRCFKIIDELNQKKAR